MTNRLIKAASILVLVGHLFGVNMLAGQNSKQGQAWPYKDIDAFFKEPLVNFESLKKLEDLQDKMSKYIKYNRDIVEDFFKGFFERMDDKKMEIIMFVLSIYPYDIIADWGARAFRLYPELFLNNLEQYYDWRPIVAGISERWEEFFPGLAQLGNSKYENNIKEFATTLYQSRESLYQKRQEIMETISSFIKDPIQYFDKVKRIGDICIWIERFDRDKNNGIYPRSAIDYFIQKHLQQIDEKKIEILLYMLLNCFDGCNKEAIDEMVARVFNSRIDLFVNVLKRSENWKRIIDSIIDVEWETVMGAATKLGNSDFEKELRAYILSYKR